MPQEADRGLQGEVAGFASKDDGGEGLDKGVGEEGGNKMLLHLQ